MTYRTTENLIKWIEKHEHIIKLRGLCKLSGVPIYTMNRLRTTGKINEMAMHSLFDCIDNLWVSLSDVGE